MNTQLLKRITFDPDQCGGKPCIRNMRIRVTDVIELLANGLTPEQIISDELPDLKVRILLLACFMLLLS